MKVLQIASGYFGSALYQNLFDSLESQGIVCETVVPTNNFVDLAKSTVTLHVYLCRSRIKRILFFPKQKDITKSIVKDLEFSSLQLTHAHTLFSCGYAAWVLKKTKNIPYIVAVRNTDVYTFFRFMPHLHKVGIDILVDATRIVFLSPMYLQTVISRYIPEEMRTIILEKSVIIPNGIDSLFIKSKQICDPPIDTIRLIYIGDIERNKNIKTTIKSIQYLLSEGMEIELIIVGEIKNKKYKYLFSRYTFIQYHEKVNKEKVLEYLQAAHIFIMPSHHETFGLVYAEAMSQGLPVIYTKGQGFDGQFEEGTVGYHVDAKDPHDIAEKIKMVIDNYEQLSSNCLSSVGKFDWKRIAEQYESVYKDVLKQASD